MAKILCVEDYVPNAMLIKDLLELTGDYTVQIAEDGVVGLEMALTNEFDLLLVDLQMPRMDGWSLIRELQENPAFRKVPMVIMYGGTAILTRESFGGLPWITKPINTRELPSIIARFLAEAT